MGAILGFITAIQFWTQLRPAGSFGPAEAAILLWILASFVLLPTKHRRPSLIALVLYIVTGLVAASLTATIVFDRSADWSLSTLGALASASGVVFIVNSRRETYSILRGWAAAFAISTVTGYLIAWLLPSLATLAGFRIGAGRFAGLSTNPNQAAAVLLIAVACSIFSVTLIWWLRWPIAGIGVLLTLQTGSDSARTALMVGFGLLVMILLLRSLKGPIGLVLAICAIAALAGLWPRLTAIFAAQVVSPLQAEGDQLAQRQEIWGSCWEFTLSRPYFGRGYNVLPNSGWECHNAILDVGVAGGLIALIVIASGLAMLIWRLSIHATPIASAAATAVIVSQFGNSALRFAGLWLLFLIASSSDSDPDAHLEPDSDDLNNSLEEKLSTEDSRS